MEKKTVLLVYASALLLVFVSGCRFIIGSVERASYSGRYGNYRVRTDCDRHGGHDHGRHRDRERRRYEECTTRVTNIYTHDRRVTHCDRHELVVRHRIYVCPRSGRYFAQAGQGPEEFRAKVTISEDKLPKNLEVDASKANSVELESSDSGEATIVIEGGDIDALHFDDGRLVIDDPDVDVRIYASDEILDNVITP